MNQRGCWSTALAISLLVLAGCGSSSSTEGTGSGGTTGGSEAGKASNSSLASVPSIDLSNVDSSAKASTALSLAEKSVSKAEDSSLSGSVRKAEIGAKLRDTGGPSRAGCEANSHKEEIVRFSKQAQLPRCYIEAMEKGGLITIPSGEYALYSITPPEESNDDREKMCENIPENDKDAKERCRKGEGSKAGEAIQLRVGRFNDGADLHVDLCTGGALEEESTYSASGAVLTANVTHIAEWDGNEEKGNLSITANLGTTGKVTDSVITLGDGSIEATGNMIGGFGKGVTTLAATEKRTSVGGKFIGGFHDQFNECDMTFEGSAYAIFNSAQGSAKFKFAGSMCAMPISKMLPPNVQDAQLDSTLQALGLQFGITLNQSNYKTVKLCPNPGFDPMKPDENENTAPMVEAPASGVCNTIEHTGTESFTIVAAEEKGNFGTVKKPKFYIATTSDFLPEVEAFSLASLEKSVVTPAFSRNWNCGGSLVPVDFSTITKDSMALMEAKFLECNKIEEYLRNNNGMGDMNCVGEDQGEIIEGFVDQGPPDMGSYGGRHTRRANQNVNCPPDFMLDYDAGSKKYGIRESGRFEEVTLDINGSNNNIVPKLGYRGDKISSIVFDKKCNEGSVPGIATVNFDNAGTCQFECNQPSFEKPPEFGAAGGPATPQKCIDAAIPPEKCPDYCRQFIDRGETCD